MTVLMTVSGAQCFVSSSQRQKSWHGYSRCARERAAEGEKWFSLSLSRFLRVPFFEIPAPLSELFPARKWPRSFETELRNGTMALRQQERGGTGSRVFPSFSLSLSAAIFSEIRRSAENFLSRLSSSNDGAGGPKFGNGSYGYGSNSAPWRDLVPRFCITQSSISIQCRVLRVLQYSDFAAADNEQRNPKSRSWSLGALQ